MGKLFRRIYYLLNRDRLERDLEDEMTAHREMMPSNRREAFGKALQLREESRDVWGWLWLDRLRQDFLYAARGFTRDRRFTLSAFAAIALAAGAAPAVFSVVDRSLFRDLRYIRARSCGHRPVRLGLVPCDQAHPGNRCPHRRGRYARRGCKAGNFRRSALDSRGRTRRHWRFGSFVATAPRVALRG